MAIDECIKKAKRAFEVLGYDELPDHELDFMSRTKACLRSNIGTYEEGAMVTVLVGGTHRSVSSVLYAILYGGDIEILGTRALLQPPKYEQAERPNVKFDNNLAAVTVSISEIRYCDSAEQWEYYLLDGIEEAKDNEFILEGDLEKAQSGVRQW